MKPERPFLRGLLIAALATTFAGGSARAVIDIVDTDSVRFSFGGYTRAFTGMQLLDLDAIPEPLRPAERVGLGASILRTEWKLNVEKIFTFEVHNRFYWLMTSEPRVDQNGQAGAVGAGVSVTPDRTVNLRSVIVDDDTLLFEHDLDRLVARFYVGPVDISVGRQAITWGFATLFTVADLWASFSPFDLDTSQKRGIDALRVVASPAQDVELDFIVADRGSLEDLSGGMRAVFYTSVADVYVAAGKFWNELQLISGISATVDAFKLRAEIAGIYAIDDERFELPRATIGFDWFVNADLFLTVEAHFNGLGAADPSDYVDTFQSEPLSRGETYLVGRYYGGFAVSYKPHELISLTLSTLVNMDVPDASAIIAWSFGYDVAQDVQLGLGGFHGVGQPIGLTGTSVAFRSEFGAYGQLLYLQLAAFF